MAIYLFTFAYLAFFGIIELRYKVIKPKGLRLVLLATAFLILFYMSGFRYGLESDYWTYYYEFYEGRNRRLEVLFAALMAVVRFFLDDYNFFLIVTALISIGLKFRLFRGYQYPFVALFVYYVRFFVQFDLNAIRQGLALVLLLVAYREFERNNYRKFYFIVLIAGTIHASALIAAVVPILNHVRLSWKKVVGILAFSVIFRLVILDRVLGYYRQYMPVVDASNVKIINYLMYFLNNSTANSFRLGAYARIIVPVLCFYFLTHETKCEGLFKIYMLGATINLMFWGMDTVGYRLAACYYIVEIPLLSGILALLSEKKTSMRADIARWSGLLFIVFCDIWTFFSLLNSSETLVPFRNFITQ